MAPLFYSYSSGNGACPLLIWETIADATMNGKTLDADGFNSGAHGASLAKFGLTPTVRPVITKGFARWHLLCAARMAVSGLGLR